MGAYFEAAADAISCGEGSAEQRRPFPHAGQAVTGRRGAVCAASWTVVLDDDVDGRRPADHPHADPGITRVLQHIGERLLHDPVHRRAYRRRIRRRFAVDLQGDREARRADAVHEGGELGESGLWFAQLIWLVLITHDVEQPAQLGEGLPAAAFDVGQRLARPGRLVLENTLGRYRLHDHDTDVVRDHVVQLPGETNP